MHMWSLSISIESALHDTGVSKIIITAVSRIKHMQSNEHTHTWQVQTKNCLFTQDLSQAKEEGSENN